MEYNTRILIVDDNESIHSDFRKVLLTEKSEEHEALDELESELFGDDETAGSPSAGDEENVAYQVDSAYQGQEALAKVEQAAAEGHPYAMIFMDVRMPPGWAGIETISHIWIKHPYIEMVLCTAYSDYTWDDIVEKLGCTDKLLFLRKPFDAVAVQQMALSLIKKWNLGNQARHYVQNLEYEVEQRTQQLKGLLKELESKNAKLNQTNAELKHIALHDPLTDLPNRILYHDRLRHAIELASRTQGKFAVAVMDLNDFKKINDQRGHQIGDEVLRVVGERLQSVLRASDTVARMGGDEFSFVLPAVDASFPYVVAQKIYDAMLPPIPLKNEELTVKCSLGLAIYPDHGSDSDTLLSKADAAMYEAKRSGAGVIVHDSENLSPSKAS